MSRINRFVLFALARLVGLAITHPDMVAIVAAHGLVPVPVDIDTATMAPTLASLHRAISPQARALVVAHLLGGGSPRRSRRSGNMTCC